VFVNIMLVGISLRLCGEPTGVPLPAGDMTLVDSGDIIIIGLVKDPGFGVSDDILDPA
jgi:hypothetical protein